VEAAGASCTLGATEVAGAGLDCALWLGGGGAGRVSKALSIGATLPRLAGIAALTDTTGRLGADSLRAIVPGLEEREIANEPANTTHAAKASSGTRRPKRAPSLLVRSQRRSTPNVFMVCRLRVGD
jgi:hypothetical protein